MYASVCVCVCETCDAARVTRCTQKVFYASLRIFDRNHERKSNARGSRKVCICVRGKVRAMQRENRAACSVPLSAAQVSSW